MNMEKHDYITLHVTTEIEMFRKIHSNSLMLLKIHLLEID